MGKKRHKITISAKDYRGWVASYNTWTGNKAGRDLSLIWTNLEWAFSRVAAVCRLAAPCCSIWYTWSLLFTTTSSRFCMMHVPCNAVHLVHKCFTKLLHIICTHNLSNYFYNKYNANLISEHHWTFYWENLDASTLKWQKILQQRKKWHKFNEYKQSDTINML